MSYNSVEFSKYIISRLNNLKADDNRYEYDNTKIQKLLYILYGFYWAKRQLRLLDEQPKLWPYGPVFPKVYKYIKKNGFEFNFQNVNPNQEDILFFDDILKTCGIFKAGKLSNWSHSKDSPWDKAKEREIRNYGETKWIDPLDDEEIREYFSKFTF